METKVAMVVLWMMLSIMLKLKVLSLKLNILIQELQANAKLMVVPSKFQDTLTLPKETLTV